MVDVMHEFVNLKLSLEMTHHHVSMLKHRAVRTSVGIGFSNPNDTVANTHDAIIIV